MLLNRLMLRGSCSRNAVEVGKKGWGAVMIASSLRFSKSESSFIFGNFLIPLTNTCLPWMVSSVPGIKMMLRFFAKLIKSRG